LLRNDPARAGSGPPVAAATVVSVATVVVVVLDVVVVVEVVDVVVELVEVTDVVEVAPGSAAGGGVGSAARVVVVEGRICASAESSPAFADDASPARTLGPSASAAPMARGVPSDREIRLATELTRTTRTTASTSIPAPRLRGNRRSGWERKSLFMGNR